MAWLDVHLVMVLLQVGLLLLQDAVDEALIGGECLEEISGDLALEPVRLLCLVDVEVVALDVGDGIENLGGEGSGFGFGFWGVRSRGVGFFGCGSGSCRCRRGGSAAAGCGGCFDLDLRLH